MRPDQYGIWTKYRFREEEAKGFAPFTYEKVKGMPSPADKRLYLADQVFILKEGKEVFSFSPKRVKEDMKQVLSYALASIIARQIFKRIGW